MQYESDSEERREWTMKPERRFITSCLWSMVIITLTIQLSLTHLFVRAVTLYAQGHSTPCISGPSYKDTTPNRRELSDTTLLGDLNCQVSAA